MNAKELLNEMRGDKWWETYDNAIEFLCDYDAEHGGIDIVDCDTVEEIVKHELEDGGLLRLKCFLAGVELGSDYYYLDGYGNLKNITRDWIEVSLEDIIANEGE